MSTLTPPRGLSMTLLMGVALALFLLWAGWFEIDQAVRAQGQLIPGARTQIIQAADGGVLSHILVQEGQVVVAGQELAMLERERPAAAFQEGRAKHAALSAALVRAQAEAAGRAPVFDVRFTGFEEFVQAQKALYAQRQSSLKEEIATLRDGEQLAQQELDMNESLLKTGDISRLEVMRAKRQVAELQGRASALRNKVRQEARQEASKLVEELMSSRYKLEERQSILDHTTITAPLDGIVKYLRFNTIGGVLRAGDELMQISPTDGAMVIEVKLNPVDIGLLKLGQPVAIKLDAFDDAVYGSLKGELSYISSDTLSEPTANGQGSNYYRAQVHIHPQSANAKMAEVALKPGMTVSVDIRTGRRSVLTYIAKPIVKAFSGAMNER